VRCNLLDDSTAVVLMSGRLRNRDCDCNNDDDDDDSLDIGMCGG